MMTGYKENPKTKGSGIVCAIPQTGRCPNECEDCFFQSGRSYLEPLDENLPNMPMNLMDRIVRVNDGNDSNVDREEVLRATQHYIFKFYNTAIPNNLEGFEEPVVLTINPGKMTNKGFYTLYDIPKNLMFVRIRTNMWNLHLVLSAVKHYTEREVPVVLTFMAYFDTADNIPESCRQYYTFRKRTTNSYWAITTEGWEIIMNYFKYNKWVHSCGKIEGEKGDTHCRFCGNCLREYYATLERMKCE